MFQGNWRLSSDGDRNQVAEIRREEKIRKKIPKFMLFHHIMLTFSILFIGI